MKKKHVIDSISACLLIVLGIAGLILMALFWNRTIDSGEQKVSLFFFLLVFFNGAVDCCSTVIYFPWIKHYPKLYTSALTIGEGLTGGIAGILALIQQPCSDNPLFSFSAMCYILACFMVISWISFMCVWVLPCGRAQVIQHEISEHLAKDVLHPEEMELQQATVLQQVTVLKPEEAEQQNAKSEQHPTVIQHEEQQHEAVLQQEESDAKQAAVTQHEQQAEAIQHEESEQRHVKIQDETQHQDNVQPVEQSKLRWIHCGAIRLILVQATISFLDNGILVALTPYVFKSYPYASQLLSYGLALSLIADPVACFVAYWICFTNYTLLWAVHAVWLVGMLVQIIIGFLHNNPPLKESLAFGIVLVAIKVVTKGFLSFGKTTEFLKVHKSKTAYEPFRLAGLAIQVSALVGSLIMLFALKD